MLGSSLVDLSFLEWLYVCFCRLPRLHGFDILHLIANSAQSDRQSLFQAAERNLDVETLSRAAWAPGIAWHTQPRPGSSQTADLALALCDITRSHGEALTVSCPSSEPSRVSKMQAPAMPLF
ncbi:unnamed protein product [Rangifer tarandus platyrhynchus]|uniref:Uncharacterized protein n=2 Tax=Rangifer tarandus platyrhynchus TaxID=3082113 RepID=A0ABN8ZLG1_RANTA|nr:unnamed protein product [Rangifer tarandus platyrhynchus]CAI9706790.1 unnamed protein product [Rangifer tarandus platyrhynchus]